MSKSFKTAIALAFLSGYFFSNVINNATVSFITEANAGIYGLSPSDFVGSYAFKTAVMSTVEENCRTDVRFKGTVNTWFYCESNSRYAPANPSAGYPNGFCAYLDLT